MPKFIDSIGARPEKEVEPVVMPKTGRFARGRKAYHASIAESHNANQEHLSGGSNTPTRADRARRPHSPRLMLVVAGLFLLTLVTVVMYVQLVQKKQTPTAVVNDACSVQNTALTDDAIAAINSQDVLVLKDKADKIKQLSNYDTDQTCLAVIGWQQMFIGEFDSAQAFIDKIKPIYDPALERGSNQAIYVGNPDRMQAYLATLRQSYDKSKNSGSVFQSKSSSGANR